MYAVYLPMPNFRAPVFFKVNQVLVSNILNCLLLLSPVKDDRIFTEIFVGLKQTTN